MKDKNQVRVYSTAFNFIEFCLVLRDKDLKQVCKYLGVKRHEFDEMSKAGRVDFLENLHTRQNMAVVRIAEDKEFDLAAHIGLITHEAVHIKQQIISDIGEEIPSSEFEAYLTQEITVSLVSEFLRRSKLFR